MSLLSIQNVTKQFGSFYANKDLSLDLTEGKIFGLLGPNGAGKTTLIRMINRIMLPDSGSIQFHGHELSDSDLHNIGYLPEERGMYTNMQLKEQILFFAKLKGMDTATINKRLPLLLDRYNLTDHQDKKIHALSKGMQQKAQFIITIMHEPALLILDEPFTGLDPVNTNLMKQEIRQLQQQGTTIIFSTHRMEQVEEICEEIALIHNGTNILQGSVHDVQHQHKQDMYRLQLDRLPDHDYLLQLFGPDVTIEYEKKSLVFSSSRENASYIIKELIQKEYIVVEFREILPSLHDIFISLVS